MILASTSQAIFEWRNLYNLVNVGMLLVKVLPLGHSRVAPPFFKSDIWMRFLAPRNLQIVRKASLVHILKTTQSIKPKLKVGLSQYHTRPTCQYHFTIGMNQRVIMGSIFLPMNIGPESFNSQSASTSPHFEACGRLLAPLSHKCWLKKGPRIYQQISFCYSQQPTLTTLCLTNPRYQIVPGVTHFRCLPSRKLILGKPRNLPVSPPFLPPPHTFL